MAALAIEVLCQGSCRLTFIRNLGRNSNKVRVDLNLTFESNETDQPMTQPVNELAGL